VGSKACGWHALSGTFSRRPAAKSARRLSHSGRARTSVLGLLEGKCPPVRDLGRMSTCGAQLSPNVLSFRDGEFSRLCPVPYNGA
jgi:hypothetical protein